MNKRIESEVARAKEVGVFILDHTITPPILRVVELAAAVTAFVTQAEDEGGDQVEGFGDFRGGSATRRQQAVALQTRLREIGSTARRLPQDQYPGTREKFIVGTSLRYQQLIDVGHGFLAALGPVKAAFVARAYPPDFDEKLAEQVAAFETATQQKARGRQQRRGGTAGLPMTMKKAKDAIDELDSILSVYYRQNNPALLPVWKLAKRVQRPAYGTAPAPIPASSDSGSSPNETGPTLAPTKGSAPAPASGDELPNGNNNNASGEATGTNPTTDSPAN